MEQHENNRRDAADRAAGAPRRPTGDPRRFLVPHEALAPGFADRVERGDFEPVPPRPAATVVLSRETAGRVEVLLLRRPMRSGFAAGAWVFPGGRVDPADAEPSISGRMAGPGSGAWTERLGLQRDDEALGYVVAALREAWEETGILIGTAAAPPHEMERLRTSLLAETVTLAEAARRADIRFATDHLLYIAHWTTPEPEPRRYDTRFFLARVPEAVECRLHGDELSEARWFSPAEAVDRFHAGELSLLPPTVDTLRRLAPFQSLDAAWEALRGVEVREILPRMVRDPRGVVIEF